LVAVTVNVDAVPLVSPVTRRLVGVRPTGRVCSGVVDAPTTGFSTMLKKLALDAWRQAC
jgi:hypothetical protein